jgi:hypothetical protein
MPKTNKLICLQINTISIDMVYVSQLQYLYTPRDMANFEFFQN